jgi:peptidoglycan hydrolase-like protein with peptidoglycan-binding domain
VPCNPKETTIMEIISRKSWGARSPQSTVHTTTWSRRTGFVVHHSGADDDQTVKEIQRYHMDSNGWSDIGYNFLVDKKGRIYEGRGWLGIGAHVAGHNTATIGVCVIGDYRSELPSTKALQAVAWLLKEAERRKGRDLSIFGHRDLGSTACPGGDLYGWVRSKLDDYKAPSTPSKPSTPRPPAGKAAPGPHYDFPLPASHYFGPRNGPDKSVSGYHDRTFKGRTDNEWLKLWAAQLGKRGWDARRGGDYLTRYGNDGKYGPEYEKLVRAFQADQGLTVDGKLGPKTWAAAFENPVT